MKKRIVCLVSILAILLSSLGLYGCKPKKRNDENFLEIYVANFGYGYEWLDAVIEEFKKQPYIKEKYPNLDIGMVKNSEYNFAVDRINAGDKNTIDLFFTASSCASSYEKAGKKSNFENLEEVYNSKVEGEEITIKEKMDKNFLDMNTFTRLDGSETYYSMPWVAGMQGLVYNKTLFTSNGWEVPNTSNGLYELSKDILQSKVTAPFVFSSKENYWTSIMFLVWWAQYEGNENYSNFYKGIVVDENGRADYSPEIFNQDGRLESLKLIDSLISYGNDLKFAHPDVNTMEFTEAQSQFLLGKGAMMPNGDWFENEMRRTATEEGITDEFTFMKTPVISSITKKLEDKTMTDDTLSAIIAQIDNGAVESTLCSDKDFKKISEARNIILPVSNHVGVIPSYSTAKEPAKDFLKFMATDKANNAFIKKTHGMTTPFKYDVKLKDEALYNSLPLIQRDRLDMQSNAIYMLAPETYRTVYYGGITYFTQERGNIDALFTARDSKDRRTAQKIFDDEKAYWTYQRWDSVLTNAGLK